MKKITSVKMTSIIGVKFSVGSSGGAVFSGMAKLRRVQGSGQALAGG